MGERISTGLADLDRMLGGGLLPGTMTVVMGATGVGKTQLGIHFLEAGRRREGEPGIVFDMTSRGDSQNHIDYARRMCGWEMTERLIDEAFRPEQVWDRETTRRDLFHIFRRSGRRVTRQDMDTTDWQEWKVELNQKLDQAIAFFYGNFVHGVRRCVIDGIEPVEKVSESFQFHVFDYIYHQILHKDADWVAGSVPGPLPRTGTADPGPYVRPSRTGLPDALYLARSPAGPAPLPTHRERR